MSVCYVKYYFIKLFFSIVCLIDKPNLYVTSKPKPFNKPVAVRDAGITNAVSNTDCFTVADKQSIYTCI